MRLALAALFTVAANSVFAGGWFTHPFGELRAYYGDWLAVCSDNGNGLCRAVTFGEGTFTNPRAYQRISVSQTIGGDFGLELGDRRLVTNQVAGLQLAIGSKTVDVPFEQADAVALDTFEFTDATLVQNLVDQMKAARFATLRVTEPSGFQFEATYSLRGLRAALNAIEERT
ncbi:MAG: hypothetical protein AAF826_06330 [Pseudomonadota bacterium]